MVLRLGRRFDDHERLRHRDTLAPRPRRRGPGTGRLSTLSALDRYRLATCRLPCTRSPGRSAGRSCAASTGSAPPASRTCPREAPSSPPTTPRTSIPGRSDSRSGPRQAALLHGQGGAVQSRPQADSSSAAGRFPVRRGENDMQAVETAVRLCREGKIVAMFPEGTRQQKGLRKKFDARPRSGSARIALAAGRAPRPGCDQGHRPAAQALRGSRSRTGRRSRSTTWMAGHRGTPRTWPRSG